MLRYQQLDVPVYDTVSCGALLWRSEAPAQARCQREPLRYWRHLPPALTP
jgi:hypothetical protein